MGDIVWYSIKLIQIDKANWTKNWPITKSNKNYLMPVVNKNDKPKTKYIWVVWIIGYQYLNNLNIVRQRK